MQQRDKLKPILFSIIKHSSKEELKEQIPKDIVAGVVVAVVALPLSIALGCFSCVVCFSVKAVVSRHTPRPLQMVSHHIPGAPGIGVFRKDQIPLIPHPE